MFFALKKVTVTEFFCGDVYGCIWMYTWLSKSPLSSVVLTPKKSDVPRSKVLNFSDLPKDHMRIEQLRALSDAINFHNDIGDETTPTAWHMTSSPVVGLPIPMALRGPFCAWWLPP